jgi:hypothetical protein
LEDSGHDQQNRRPTADIAVDRQQARHRRPDRHQHDRDHQDPLASDPVTKRAEDEPAERAHDKRGGQRAERRDQVDCKSHTHYLPAAMLS